MQQLTAPDTNIHDLEALLAGFSAETDTAGELALLGDDIAPVAPLQLEELIQPTDNVQDLLTLDTSEDAALPADVTVEAQPETNTAPAQEKQKRAKKEKPAAAPKVFWGRNKIGRLESGLGEKLADYFVLTVEDAGLEGAALGARVKENREIFTKLGVKVQSRATNLIEYASGKTQRLTPVSEIALRLLAADGQITTGDKGNLIQKLLAKPYALSAARAMGNNTLNFMRAFKMVVPNATGALMPNPRSLLLMAMVGKLALQFDGDDDTEQEQGAPAQSDEDHEGQIDVSAATPAPLVAVDDPGLDSAIEALLGEAAEHAEEVTA